MFDYPQAEVRNFYPTADWMESDFSTQVSPQSKLDKQISWIESLPDGWHNGKGQAFRFATIAASRDLLVYAKRLGGKNINVAPDINGSLLVSFDLGEVFVQTYVHPGRAFNVILETQDGDELPTEPDLNTERLKRTLAAIAGNPIECDSLERLKSGTTMESGLSTWLLKQMTEWKMNLTSEFLQYPPSVSKLNSNQHART